MPGDPHSPAPTRGNAHHPASTSGNARASRTPRNARAAPGFSSPFGIPLGELGPFATIIMVVALAFGAFFLATFVAIIVLLGMGASPGHPVNYALSYRRVGLPAGCAVGVLALIYFSILWVRRLFRHS